MPKNKLNIPDAPRFGTLRELIEYITQRYGDTPAFILPQDDGSEIEKSFTAFAGDIGALGAALFGQGLRDCRVALLGENSYEWIISYFAVANGGNTVVPLDRDLPAGDLAPLVEASGCTALIYARSFRDILPAFQSGTSVRRYICMDELEALLAQGRQLLGQGDTAYTACPLSPDTLAAIVYTSGTTGSPKGVMLTHTNIAGDAASICRMSGGAGTCVLMLPLHHTFGLTGGLIIPLMYGVTSYLGRSLRTIQKDMVRMHATVALLVPAMVEAMHKKIRDAAEEKGSGGKLRMGLKLSRLLMKLGIDARRRLFKEVLAPLGGELNLIVCGGAPLNKRIAADYYAMGVDLLNGYGITECSPVVSVNPNHPRNRLGSVGKPLDCCEVRIGSPDENGVGEILIKGSNVMRGYYGDEHATGEAFTDDGWFKSGDLGYLDRDGYLYVTGRIKHLIILSNGKNVSPEELEERVKLLPGVLETAVYGARDKIVAEIYAEPGTEEALRGAVKAMNNALPPYKQIAAVKFRGAPFPKTTTMKIKKHSLKENDDA